MAGGNILFKLGGSSTIAVTFGDESGYIGAYWQQSVDEYFERYTVRFGTSVSSWKDRDQWEGSLANSLHIGPLQTQTFPRGAAKIVSLANSGGTLVNTFNGTTVTSVFPERVEIVNWNAWGIDATVTFVRARQTALVPGAGGNLFYYPGGQAAQNVPLGIYENSEWTPSPDVNFVRYDCTIYTQVESWKGYEEYERTLANSLHLGALEIIPLPHGAAYIHSWANSGGSLVNSLNGTTITSVWPQSISPGRRGGWNGEVTVSFIAMRSTAMTGGNLYYHIGGSAANVVQLGDYEQSEWTAKIDDKWATYDCGCITKINSWAGYTDFEASVATTVALGKLELLDLPRAGKWIKSWANSGGSLVNSYTSTTITSVFPQLIESSDHEGWNGRYRIVFVKPRADALTGGNIRYGGDVVTDTNGVAPSPGTTVNHSNAGSYTGLSMAGGSLVILGGSDVLTGVYSIVSNTADAVVIDRDCRKDSQANGIISVAMANGFALGDYEATQWTPQVDPFFERYRCTCVTKTESWPGYESFEATLANSLVIGPLTQITYPRGGARIVCFANSGGTLHNRQTGTIVRSVFPEEVQGEDHDQWAGRFAVTFVRAR